MSPISPASPPRCSDKLADIGVNVDMIVQNVSDHGVTDISFTVPNEELDASVEAAQTLAEAIVIGVRRCPPPMPRSPG